VWKRILDHTLDFYIEELLKYCILVFYQILENNHSLHLDYDIKEVWPYFTRHAHISNEIELASLFTKIECDTKFNPERTRWAYDHFFKLQSLQWIVCFLSMLVSKKKFTMEIVHVFHQEKKFNFKIQFLITCVFILEPQMRTRMSILHWDLSYRINFPPNLKLNIYFESWKRKRKCIKIWGIGNFPIIYPFNPCQAQFCTYNSQGMCHMHHYPTTLFWF